MIEFAPLGAFTTDGRGSGGVTMRSRLSGAAQGVTLNGRGQMLARFRSAGAGSSEAGGPEQLIGGSADVITYNIGSGGSTRTQNNTPELLTQFDTRGRAFGLGGIGNLGFRSRMQGFAESAAPETFGGVTTHAIVYGFTGVDTVTLVESAALDTAMRIDLSILVLQPVPVIDRGRSLAESSASITEAVTFDDAILLTYKLLVAEGVRLADTPAESYAAVARVVDSLMLTGRFQTFAEASALLVASLAMGIRLGDFAQWSVTEQVALRADTATLLTAAAEVLDRLLVAGQPVGTGTAMALVREGVALGEAPTTMAEVFAAIRESIRFAIRLGLDTGEYVAWAINTESKHLSSYADFPINSFAVLGGRVLAASSDGIYALEGDDDAGEPIAARVRFALTRMGSGLHKRMPEAFIGLTATGDVLVKVIQTDEVNGKEAHVYRLIPRQAAAPTQSRVKFGRGLRSVYYGFELENVAGANFELDTIEVHPLVLESRTRGNGRGQ